MPAPISMRHSEPLPVVVAVKCESSTDRAAGISCRWLYKDSACRRLIIYSPIRD